MGEIIAEGGTMTIEKFTDFSHGRDKRVEGYSILLYMIMRGTIQNPNGNIIYSRLLQ